MSTPASITVSLECAKQLREAGYPQANHEFYWIHSEHGRSRVHRTEEDSGGRIASRLVVSEPEILYAAPTAEEILARLPEWSEIPETMRVEIIHSPLKPSMALREGANRDGTIKWKVWFEDISLANAAAAMYCYLAENNLLPKT